MKNNFCCKFHISLLLSITIFLLLSFQVFGEQTNFTSEANEYRYMGFDKVRQEYKDKTQKERAVALVEQVFQFSKETKPETNEKLSNLPKGSKLIGVVFPEENETGIGSTIQIQIDFPDEFINSSKFTEFIISKIGEEFLHALFEENFSTYLIYARDPKTGNIVDIQELLPKEEIKKFVEEPDYTSIKMSKKAGKPETRDIQKKNAIVPTIAPGNVSGALANKTIYINQSHGWFDDIDFGRWRIQRGNCYNIIEDFSSPEFMNIWVLPLLRNAGAKVQMVREMDLQTNMVIVDNADGVSNPSNGKYLETGAWETSTINGFKQKTTATWVGVSINPFNQGSGQNRLALITTGAATATATWIAAIPADGYYNVYASWAAYSARAKDAQYLIYHSGGVTEVKMNQTIDGYTWNLLGNFYFEKNAPEDQRKVVLTNKSSDTTATNVSADAVRWGGGMGDVERHTHGISGRPRWEEEAVNYLQFNGFGYSGTLYTGDDDESGGWSDRAQYAGWEHSGKDGGVEDALYFAFHTNAYTGCGSTARGLATYRHTTATAASQQFQTIMHDTMYDHITSLWIPGWTARSKNATNFGENNQASLGTNLPGFLIEGLFHDNEADCAAYGDPRFRYLYARAIVHGIIKYFETRDSIDLKSPPEPPQNFRIISQNNGTSILSWDVPLNSSNNSHYGDPAVSYLVYKSTNGFGFDNGTPVSGTSYTATGLVNGQAVFFRVAAVNTGGISLPTETLATSAGGSRVLIVNGFDRNQNSLIPKITITNAGTTDRHDPRIFQAFNYIIEHAKAIVYMSLQISSTSNEAVINGQVNLTDYAAVYWICGEESTADETLNTTEQTKIQDYLNGGGKLFISGSEIGYDLGRSGSSTAADIAFYNNYLKASYVGDDAGTYAATGSAGIFQNLGALSFINTSARYDAEAPDQLGVSGGSTVNMTYSGGSAGNAGIQYSGTYKLVMLGFPFETIVSAQTRQDIMTAVANFFELGGTPVITPTPTPYISPSPSPTPSPTPIPPDSLIIEVRDSAGTKTSAPLYNESGSWSDSSAKSTAEGLTGLGSRFSDSATVGTDNASVIPNFPKSGICEVFVTWGTSSNANNVKYTVKHAGGSNVVYLNQIPGSSGNANVWHSLGKYSFNTGQNEATGSVAVDESTVTGPAGTYNTGRVYTDAFKFAYEISTTPTPPPSPTPSATPNPTATPTPSPTNTPIPTPTATPITTPTPIPTPSPYAITLADIIAHINGIKILTDPDAITAADMNKDEKIDISDVVAWINKHSN